MERHFAWAVLCILGFLAGCEEGGANGGAPSEPYTNFFTPLPATAVFPAENPYSDAKRDLGEFLFWDPILSGRMNVACASCHHPDHGWADGREFSVGIDGIGLGPGRTGVQVTDFHSPTVLNVAFTGIDATQPAPDFVAGGYFWDLRVQTLEEQAVEPIKNAVEMRSPDFLEDEIFPEIINRLSLIPEYEALFAAAFPEPDPITEDNIARAIATYQRTLITQPTRFDAFLAGDDAALTNAEITGLNKFINGGCADCHSGPMLADNLIDVDKPVQRNMPAVRTPTMRNVELTGPYFQDGSKGSLRSAIAHYEDRDDLDVNLEEDDFGDVERFLRTLTDPDFPRDIPASVPSNLPVGGDI